MMTDEAKLEQQLAEARAEVERLRAELETALAAAARRIGEMEEVFADIADGFDQQGKYGIASQLRQLLPAVAPSCTQPEGELKCTCSVVGGGHARSCPHNPSYDVTPQYGTPDSGVGAEKAEGERLEPCGVRITEMRRCMRSAAHEGPHLDTHDAAWRPEMLSSVYRTDSGVGAHDASAQTSSPVELATARDDGPKNGTQGTSASQDSTGAAGAGSTGVAVGDLVKWEVSGRTFRVTDTNLDWVCAQGGRIKPASRLQGPPDPLDRPVTVREMCEALRNASEIDQDRDGMDAGYMLRCAARLLEAGRKELAK